ncbi:hypothetical protein ATO3_16860 [Marinibacterium profundimaris]|uniref:Glycosyl transferase family 1 domain-containing protein n=1 Tax=Marinibacterium profundimaris TaxID=1679460 RepID=A0A225NG03_9RHOB|nr:hypothetical protein ATO3_16860 [Marinibacterium profundimaris]
MVINDHSRPNGGAAVLMLAALRGLRARGVPVTLITGDSGDNPDLQALGVEVVAAGGADLLARPKLQAATRGMHDPAARRLVEEVVARRDGPGTVYHVHNWSQILTPAIFEALRPVAERCFLHAHDSFLACPNGMYMDYRHHDICTRVPLGADCLATHCDKRSYPHKLWRVARHALLWRCLDRSAPWGGVLAIHPRQAEGFVRAGFPAPMVRVVRNPATPWRATRVRAEENRTLVYVGRLEEDKGVMDLVRAAARTGQHLRLIGEGSLRARIALDYPDVALAGWQSAEAIGALVADARALVMPSHHPEPFGLVVAEASACGLPVLLSDSGALAGDVERLGLGMAFDVHDPAALDAALVRIRDMEAEHIGEISENAMRRAGQLANTPEAWIGVLVDLFEAAAGRAIAGRRAAAC